MLITFFSQWIRTKLASRSYHKSLKYTALACLNHVIVNISKWLSGMLETLLNDFMIFSTTGYTCYRILSPNLIDPDLLLPSHWCVVRRPQAKHVHTGIESRRKTLAQIFALNCERLGRLGESFRNTFCISSRLRVQFRDQHTYLCSESMRQVL